MATHEHRPAWVRGVLASYGPVTPVKEDASRFKLSLRDAILLFAGCLAMYGAQQATQWGLRSDIRDLGTKFESYQQRQMTTNDDLQRQIDEARRTAAGARIAADDATVSLAELKGILIGAGIKNIPLTKLGGPNDRPRTQ
jgi:hypothetical protein